MSLLLLSRRRGSGARVTTRTGIVTQQGRVVRDDGGVFHPLGLTLFWSLYGWKFERSRILDHLKWISQYHFDYVRILGEVDWVGRSIEPTWPDYVPVVQEFVDAAYDQFGLRIEMTIIGGRQFDEHDGHQRFVPTELARQVGTALKGREHKVLHYECANEWDRLDKVTLPDLIDMGGVLAPMVPNLVALSRPAESSSTALVALESGTRVEPSSAAIELAVLGLMNLAARRGISYNEAAELLRWALAPGGDLKGLLGGHYRKNLHGLLQILTALRQEYGPDVDTRESVDQGGREEMINATKTAGANTYTPHLRRSDHDEKWSHVRQGYDLKDYPTAVSNNEPQGPQSSVDTLDDPLQLACARVLGIICGGAPYVLHVGQGVTGEADPNHGRPENMWEVPNIDTIMRVVRGVDVLVPPGIEAWKVVNNGRSDHPLPLDPETGFWEGSHPGPAVNKNYAAYSGNEFRVILIGCKSAGETGPVPAGTAIRKCRVILYDPSKAYLGLEAAQVGAPVELQPGESWSVPGRGDTMAGYVVAGTYL